MRMKKNFSLKNKGLKVIGLVAIIYVANIFVKQQISMNKYEKEYLYYENKKQEEIIKNEELIEEKENVGTNEYIEKVAREKLGLVLPNETIFIDATRY